MAAMTTAASPLSAGWAYRRPHGSVNVFENQPSGQVSIVRNRTFAVVTNRSSKGRIEAPARETAFIKVYGRLAARGRHTTGRAVMLEELVSILAICVAAVALFVPRTGSARDSMRTMTRNLPGHAGDALLRSGTSERGSVVNRQAK